MLLIMLNCMATLFLPHFKKYLVIVLKNKEIFGLTAVHLMGYYQLNLMLSFGHKLQLQQLAICTSTITIWTVRTGQNSQHLDLFLSLAFSHSHHSLLMKEY